MMKFRKPKKVWVGKQFWIIFICQHLSSLRPQLFLISYRHKCVLNWTGRNIQRSSIKSNQHRRWAQKLTDVPRSWDYSFAPVLSVVRSGLNVMLSKRSTSDLLITWTAVSIKPNLIQQVGISSLEALAWCSSPERCLWYQFCGTKSLTVSSIKFIHMLPVADQPVLDEAYAQRGVRFFQVSMNPQ